MNALLKIFLCLGTAGLVYAQQPPPTDIYLLGMKFKKNNYLLTQPQNITARAGYDNQPHFHPEKPLLYYSSAGNDGRTDIKVYNYKTGETRLLTQTAEREYSPTVTPDGKFISCIIQRDNGAQDLGKYPIDGGEPVVIINNLIVGYHAWINEHQLLLFVLGEPNTLRLFDLRTGRDKIIAENIGRSLHRIPGSNEMSFVEKRADAWYIRKYNPVNETITTLTSTLPGREDLTWTPDGKILMSNGERLFSIHPGRERVWKELPASAAMSLKSITRLAVNRKGNKLALVASE
ncbi:MAG: hypothetical protein N2044_01310 [Cyclobacteriaceae bacterium]|nr:hypothetical protein [Cyclobacteriaceae bacterium]MCX7636460.1 hypothetical protein [Cyclobacteriaceae bacterium]MDW8330779.1 hypothetical protein [Cyclobacteriaceae bacterium]